MRSNQTALTDRLLLLHSSFNRTFKKIRVELVPEGEPTNTVITLKAKLIDNSLTEGRHYYYCYCCRYYLLEVIL